MMVKLSDYVIRWIADRGVRHIFMVPGGGAMHLNDSLGRCRDVEFVCNLHEQACAIAADAYSQYTNNLGVALVTTGPGGTNTITGAAAAWLDSTPVLFLSGHGSLVRDFAASFPPDPDPTPGTHSLKLVPHRREAEYDWLVLVVDRGTYRLRKLITADAQGGQSTFTFSDVRENTGVPDSAFRFTIPRGVDVVTHGQVRR